jgi:predicted XRE-type DNA-binding protein
MAAAPRRIFLTKRAAATFLPTWGSPAAADELTVKSTLIMAIGDTIKERDLPQQRAETGQLVVRSQTRPVGVGRCAYARLPSTV